MNNLLERLHASFFFYIMTGPVTFLKIGTYLPGAIIISVALMFGGLYEWVNAGWSYDTVTKEVDGKVLTKQSKWTRRERPILIVHLAVIVFLEFGLVLFLEITTPSFMKNQSVRSLLPVFSQLARISYTFQDPFTNTPVHCLRHTFDIYQYPST